jgi:hypothetical protein
MISIVPETEYENLIETNKYYFDRLEEIVRESGELLEGNCFYTHTTLNKNIGLINKQRNLYSIATNINSIMEIGFNAGHSALLFLLANPNSHLTCFDICSHAYTKPCFEYLSSQFVDRMDLYIGDSNSTVANFRDNNLGHTFDLIHIDGCHDYLIANIDFFVSFSMARDSTILIWDDVEIPSLKILWEGYIKSNMVTEFQMLPTPVYAHAFALCNKKQSNIAMCSLTLGDQYKEITKNGRKSKVLYCNKHNYTFHDDEDVYDSTRAPAWSKIKLIQRYLQSYDYVVWVDGDTMIMNDQIKLEEIIKQHSNGMDIMVAQDWTMINTGVIFIKNTEWSRKFLDLIYDQIQFLDHPNWEQASFIYLLENNISESHQHIKVLHVDDQNIFNSYWFTYYFNNCFILHFPGCWRSGISIGLQETMNKYCSIQKDEESIEEWQERLLWLEHHSRTEIDYILKRSKEEEMKEVERQEVERQEVERQEVERQEVERQEVEPAV